RARAAAFFIDAETKISVAKSCSEFRKNESCSSVRRKQVCKFEQKFIGVEKIERGDTPYRGL
ncbi:hypothetical protein, partial [Cronobacter dublinensis]|uniref:hypothetical protein n=1 Tax=Cronobacter dublinensis TaxID=413497 RepID=UPI001F2A419B